MLFCVEEAGPNVLLNDVAAIFPSVVNNVVLTVLLPNESGLTHGLAAPRELETTLLLKFEPTNLWDVDWLAFTISITVIALSTFGEKCVCVPTANAACLKLPVDNPCATFASVLAPVENLPKEFPPATTFTTLATVLNVCKVWFKPDIPDGNNEPNPILLNPGALKDGTVEDEGPTEKIVNSYISSVTNEIASYKWIKEGDPSFINVFKKNKNIECNKKIILKDDKILF